MTWPVPAPLAPDSTGSVASGSGATGSAVASGGTPVGAPAVTVPGLALVPHTHLTHPRRLGKGAFGDVDLVEYEERGLTVAVKCNGTACASRGGRVPEL